MSGPNIPRIIEEMRRESLNNAHMHRLFAMQRESGWSDCELLAAISITFFGESVSLEKRLVDVHSRLSLPMAMFPPL